MQNKQKSKAMEIQSKQQLQQTTSQLIKKVNQLALQPTSNKQSQSNKTFLDIVFKLSKGINPNTLQLIPDEHLQEFMKQYQQKMNDVNFQMDDLDAFLQQEEKERNQLDAQMDAMFGTLNELEEKFKLKDIQKINEKQDNQKKQGINKMN